ncbi:MAG: 50S ribosomal protein L23 [Candidatus Diapherotrites archaeon]|nr:50S ribosomal protein L23 [Candidatus Diapherotrites archaeon]
MAKVKKQAAQAVKKAKKAAAKSAVKAKARKAAAVEQPAVKARKAKKAEAGEGFEQKVSAEQGLKDFEIVLYPLITEKAVGMIETQNKLSFIVSRKATKQSVKKAVQELYGIKVGAIRIINDLKGRKKAIVKVNKEFKADEIATKMGVI